MAESFFATLERELLNRRWRGAAHLYHCETEHAL
jgi:hypothetical protein